MRRTREPRLRLLWIFEICCVLMLTIVAGQGAHGQTVVGRISGTVQDANGAGVPNATVKVINTANNSERTATSDENGFYTVTNLPAGTYTVEAEAKGYKKGARFRQKRNGRCATDSRYETRSRRGFGDGRDHEYSGRDGEHDLRRSHARYRSATGPEPRTQRTQLHSAPVARSRRRADQRRSARVDDESRDQQPVDQRQPRSNKQRHRRRRLQSSVGQQREPDQQRRHRLHSGSQNPDCQTSPPSTAATPARKSVS